MSEESLRLDKIEGSLLLLLDHVLDIKTDIKVLMLGLGLNDFRLAELEKKHEKRKRN